MRACLPNNTMPGTTSRVSRGAGQPPCALQLHVEGCGPQGRKSIPTRSYIFHARGHPVRSYLPSHSRAEASTNLRGTVHARVSYENKCATHGDNTQSESFLCAAVVGLTTAGFMLGVGVQQALAEAPLDLRVPGAILSPIEPPDVSWEIYFGFIAGLSPFVIAAYEFGKRILIQQRCEVCTGSGLVTKGRFKRKCPACGGFLPWESWEQFLSSEAGNGGVVRFPKGQKSAFFDVDAATAASKKMRALMEQDESSGADPADEAAGAVKVMSMDDSSPAASAPTDGRENERVKSK